MAALGSMSQDYLQGDAKADDVIEQTDSAVTTLVNTNPSDPSLSKTRTILRAMFLEYGRAIAPTSTTTIPASTSSARTVSRTSHTTSSQTRGPALAKRGCDVSPLL